MERKEAIEQGKAQYKTGRPCKYGHRGYRDTVTGACLVCKAITNAEQQQKAREAIKAAQTK